ncbi:glycosyltransferase family 2 protein [Vibrio parahaemolyticus]|uniref:glycosyltransferase family 2 protein n=1 Tax=Vibrio campbellii TaxID=680 RepID=UPI0005EEF44C|nr:glycosyltransferase family 2 protein [Vibrio campbellii]MDF5030560.1 glycosyltransferase family 2 protein [Vibrio parahaemolyticus]
MSSSLGALVSVVTPAYNCKNVILRCIKCVAEQTDGVLEHIIVDDGSVDGTSELLDELSLSYPHLKVMKQTNQGAGAARNLAIQNARGKYIAFLDADDFWFNRKLEYQISFMEKFGVDFSYGDYEREFNNDSINTTFIAPKELSYGKLLLSCPIGCLTAAYNQESLGKVYMSTVRQGQDWSLWLKITKSGVIAKKYDGVLAVYNIQEGSLSSNKKRKLINMYNIYREQPFGKVTSLLLLSIHSLNVLLNKKR